jgi:hypothetical protein
LRAAFYPPVALSRRAATTSESGLSPNVRFRDPASPVGWKRWPGRVSDLPGKSATHC